MADTHRLQFGYIEKLPAALCLALLFATGAAHADDSALVTEANAALARKDYSAAFSGFSVLAQHGNATAQFNLGAFYINGQGVQKDEKQAFEWFAKSAAQGNVRALQILQNAAAKGNQSAKNELSTLHAPAATTPTQAQAPAPRAPEVPAAPADEKTLMLEANAALSGKDYASAFPKFLTLAQQGNAVAQFDVGAFYFNGQGVQRDEKQAYDWFAKSAAQGNERAIQVMKNAAARQNVAARTSPEVPTQRAVANTSVGKSVAMKAPEAEIGMNVVPAMSLPAAVRKSGLSSSGFSIGVSAGQTGKLTGVDNSFSFGLLAGYKFNPSWGLELAYNSLYRNANAGSLLSATYPGTTGTFDLSSVSASGQYIYSLGNDLSLLGSLGVHSSSYKLSSSGSGAMSGTSNGLVVGVKIQYDLSKNIGIRGGFDTFTEGSGMTGNVTEFGLGVINRF